MQGILPPHIVDRITENGTPAQKQKARTMVIHDSRFRMKREAMLVVRMTGVSAFKRDRETYTANFGTTLPGTLIRTETSGPSYDLAVDEAHDGAGSTYSLFANIYGRNSIDDAGMKIISSAHYGRGYDNAFWNGSQMAYGDGDEDLPEAERLFNRFTISLDVIGHELSHGVTQYEAALIYYNQPGALNEHMSDVFGSLVKQYKLGHTAEQADWIIGQGLFTQNVKGVGIRSMSAPGTAYDDPVIGKDPQPAHMRDYVSTFEDNGGVHINSGIPNKAFYLVATKIGGNAWEKAGAIWYHTLKTKLNATAQFTDVAKATVESAEELFGAGSLEQIAVQESWFEVGVTDSSVPPKGCLPAPIAGIINALDEELKTFYEMGGPHP